MGRLAARDMTARATLDQAVRWHLAHNHYPPVPLAMVPTAKRAVTKLRALDPDDDSGAIHDITVKLPAGIAYKDGKSTVSLYNIANALHLWDLV